MMAKSYERLRSKIIGRIGTILNLCFDYWYLFVCGSAGRSLNIPKFDKALIIGTGPSADNLSDDLCSKYDAILFLNHAISLPVASSSMLSSSSLIWFSGDTFRLDQVKHILQQRTDIHCVYAHFLIGYWSLRSIRRQLPNLCILRIQSLQFGSYLLQILRKGWVNVIPPVSSLNRQVHCYIKHPNAGLPVLGKTSALPAILYLVRLGASRVDLIGCDFSDGRVSPLKGLGTAGFSSSDVFERFLIVSNCLKQHGIEVANLSWL
jgi:hypothetical protein